MSVFLEHVIFRCQPFDPEALVALIAIQQTHDEVVDFFKFIKTHAAESFIESSFKFLIAVSIHGVIFELVLD